MRIARAMLMAEPPSIDGNELTDKGYINQRAGLERRAASRSFAADKTRGGRDRAEMTVGWERAQRKPSGETTIDRIDSPSTPHCRSIRNTNARVAPP